MKTKLLVAAFLISAASFAQCAKCKSFKEADVDPTRVKSITMNGMMSEVEFDGIPTDINKFVNLETLYLTDFGMDVVPKEIGQLKNLKSLSLAGNTLTELPEELYNLKQVKELIISDNEFSNEALEDIQKKVKAKMPNCKLIID